MSVIESRGVHIIREFFLFRRDLKKGSLFWLDGLVRLFFVKMCFLCRKSGTQGKQSLSRRCPQWEDVDNSRFVTFL